MRRSQRIRDKLYLSAEGGVRNIEHGLPLPDLEPTETEINSIEATECKRLEQNESSAGTDAAPASQQEILLSADGPSGGADEDEWLSRAVSENVVPDVCKMEQFWTKYLSREGDPDVEKQLEMDEQEIERASAKDILITFQRDVVDKTLLGKRTKQLC
ncbi:Hypothetical predicted protein [Cloeon dipterum]|uniref:BSD domain-containing protein n=1 Tax=Cloeon dipterum TaxID=197152 RepID=A0A8S1D4I5_9INSE|nr:Hypothetical predicted protein [Cloeon dipterum]